jgi:hypothetical protein
MRKSVILGVCALVALTAADADAQWTTPLEGRLTVGLNGGGQAGSTDIDRTITFSLYEEDARIDSRQTVSAGGVFDLGFVYRVGPNWGIGLGYTTARGSADAVVEGALPHPLFFAQSRVFSAGVPNLDTRERAVHLQAVLFVPFVENVDFTFAAGPSFFRAEQDFASLQGFHPPVVTAFSEVPPTFDTVNIHAIEVVNLAASGTGFHISGDVTYSFLPNVGAAFMLRYARATLDMTLDDGTAVELRPGGFQVLVGARVRF